MAFPTTNILDTFKRTEAALSNGSKWALVNGTKTTGECLEEEWLAKSAAGEEDAAYWKVHEYTEPAVAITLGKLTSTLGRFIELGACIQNPTASAQKNGYSMRFTLTEAAKSEYTLLVQRITAGSATTIAEKTKVILATENKIGLQVARGKVTTWRKKGAEAWAELTTTADSTYTRGFVSFGAAGNKEMGCTNFEVGQTAQRGLAGALFNHVLDPFTRANEAKLSNGGKWELIAGLTNTGEINAKRWTPTNVFGTENGAFWTELPSISAPFIKAELAAETSSEKRYVALYACLSEPTSETEKSGYRLKVVREKTAGTCAFVTELMNKSVFSNATETTAVAVVAGDQIGLQVKGGKVIALHKTAGGAWTVVHEKADSTFTTGFIGIAGQGQTTATMTNFGAESIGVEGFLGREILRRITAVLSFAGTLVPPAGPVVKKLEAFLLGLRRLDSFKREAEKPLNNSGAWTIYGALGHHNIGRVFEESYAFNEGASSNRAVWALNEYSEPVALACEVHVAPGAGESARLMACVGAVGIENSYEAHLENGKMSLIREKEEPEEEVTIAGPTTVAVSPGDLMGLSVANGKVKAWYKSGTGAWTVINEAADSNYTHGFVGIGASGGSTRLRNFEVGSSFSEATLPRNTLHGLIGGLSFVGGLRKAYESFSAKLSFAGTQPRNTERDLSGALSFLGALPRTIPRPLTASLNFSGSLTPFIPIIIRKLTAALSFAGSTSPFTTHGLTGKLEFKGALPRQIARSLSGSLSFLGTLPRNILHRASAAIGPEGRLGRNTLHGLTAKLSFLGTLQRISERPLTATLTFLGSMRPMGIKTLPATLVFAGSVQRRTRHSFEALLPFSTSLLDRVIYLLMASLSFSGELTKRFTLIKTFNASLEFLGRVQRTIVLVQRGELTFAGAISRSFTKAFAATLSFAGSLQRQTLRQLPASVAFSGSVGKRIRAALEASLSFEGSLPFALRYVLSAILTFAGSIASRTITRVQQAALTFAGSITERPIKTFQAALTSSGALRRNIVHRLIGSLAFSGFIKLSGEFIQRFSASLNSSGTLSRSIKHALAASVPFSGQLGRSIVHGLNAALRAEGSLQMAVLYQLAAALAPEGSVQRETYYKLTGSVTFVGTVTRSVLHELRAALSFTGSLTPAAKLVQLLTATLSFSGQARRSITHTLRGALSFIGHINFERASGTKPLADTLVLKQEDLPTLTLRRNEAGDVYGLINHLEGFPEMEVLSIVKKRRVFGRRG